MHLKLSINQLERITSGLEKKKKLLKVQFSQCPLNMKMKKLTYVYFLCLL